MNRKQAQRLRNELSTGSMMRATERNLSHDEEDKIAEICQDLRKKLLQQRPNSSGGKGNCFEDGYCEYDISGFSPGAKYILHEEAKSRFPQLSSSMSHSKDKVS